MKALKCKPLVQVIYRAPCGEVKTLDTVNVQHMLILITLPLDCKINYTLSSKLHCYILVKEKNVKSEHVGNQTHDLQYERPRLYKLSQDEHHSNFAKKALSNML